MTKFDQGNQPHTISQTSGPQNITTIPPVTREGWGTSSESEDDTDLEYERHEQGQLDDYDPPASKTPMFFSQRTCQYHYHDLGHGSSHEFFR